MSEPSAFSPKLVQLNIQFLVPGMELGMDVISSDGKVLVSEGTLINQHLIAKLQNWDIPRVCIKAEAVTNPVADPKLRKFINNYNKSVSAVQKAFDSMRADGEMPIDSLHDAAGSIAESVADARNIVDKLYKLPPCDNLTLAHIVNVSVISALIASWLGYPSDVVNAVSLAGLLHDAGKAKLPPGLLHQPRLLAPADYEIYKKHTIYGFDLVAEVPGLSAAITSGVFEHHERTDGSGYPQGLRGNEIHPYAKIVAIADLFDEGLTINRDPEIVFSPYSSLEKLRDQIYKLDAKAGITFINRMTNFISGNIVALTDGTIGRVVFVNRDSPARSIVQLQNGAVMDLVDSDNLRISYVIR